MFIRRTTACLFLLAACIATPAHAETVCMTKSDFAKVTSGKWMPFKVKVGAKRYSGKARWLPKGKAEVVPASGGRYFGTWKVMSERKACSNYPNRKPYRLCYQIKKQCP